MRVVEIGEICGFSDQLGVLELVGGLANDVVECASRIAQVERDNAKERRRVVRAEVDARAIIAENAVFDVRPRRQQRRERSVRSVGAPPRQAVAVA